MNSTNGVNTTDRPIVLPRLAVPPPRLALDLTDTDRPVGWVSGDAIGFRGFGSHVEAAHAAWLAHRTVAHRVDRRAARGNPTRLAPEPLTLVRSGDHESIRAGDRPIAALVRPGADSPSGPHSFGFEIRVDARADELTMRSMAQLIYRTLRASGLPWAMWSRDAERDSGRESARAAGEAPRHEPRAAAAAVPTAPHRGTAPVGATLVRMAAATSIAVLVALAARPVAAPRPITIPVAVVAFATLGAAAVGEAHRRWQPRRLRPARRAPVAARPGRTRSPSRRAE